MVEIKHKGLLINLEGGEGSGKTAVIQPLVENLRSEGYIIYPTREPGGNKIGEQIREVLLDSRNTDMNIRAETLLYQAARAQVVEQSFRPRVVSGEIVITDRYYDSTIAYQGYGREQDIDTVKLLIDYATNGLKPNFSVLLDVDRDEGLRRKKGQNEWNRMDGQSLEFHSRIHQGYHDLVKEEPERWIVINANQPLENVKRDVIAKVSSRIKTELAK